MDDHRGGTELVADPLESLQRITSTFSTAVTAEQVIDELVRHATEMMDAKAWVLVLDESGQGLDTAAVGGYDSDLTASYQWIPLDAPLPLAEVVRSGQPLWYPDAHEAFDRWPRFREITGDVASIALVPLDAGDGCLGAICLCFPHPRALSANDRNYLLTLGRLGGQALRRARHYDSERLIATTLQQALLPELPDLAWTDVCARYSPAKVGAQVGGDWYDVFALPGKRVGVAVGDVSGHNIHAAATMGQLQSALRALALSKEDPGTILTDLNAIASDFPGMVMTTLFYGVWDAAGTLDYVSAGHPPPLISTPNDAARALYDTPPSVPLNVDDDTIYTTASAEMKPGETLVAYTDGLVERGSEPVDVGIARLAEILGSAPSGDLEGVCDDVLARARPPHHQDDTVLLALRLHEKG